MLDPIYILILVMFTILIVGFVFKDFWISAFAAFFSMALGVYIIINGLAGTNDWLTQAFGIICIGIGAYVGIRGSMEIIEKEM